ncbi:MAG: hypothetical protein IKR50_09620 [Prevotella sp.]|nr:hypothetical protein [Prevotella sp.]
MNISRFLLASLCVMGSYAAVAQTEQLPAFPGAEGFGRYTTGGRGGYVYHVTSLADDNSAGTLRWANKQKGPRTIVFDVSGTIYLKSALKIANNTTIAGQTAPGGGICLADFPVTLGSNVICRYMRFRLGNRQVDKHEGDGLGSMDDNNIIVDHCSVSWSIDECLSIYGGRNLTAQWCLVAQSLVNSGHSKGAHGYGGNWGGAGCSFHHNLIAHHTSRTPRLGPRQGTQTDERMDMRNNVIYNWGGNGCYGGEGMKVNIVNNYYKPGPATLKRNTTIQQRIAGIGIRTTSYCQNSDGTWNGWYPMWHVWGKFYVAGNVNTRHSNVTKDNWTYGMYNQITNGAGVDNTYTQATKDTMRIGEPIPYVAVTTHSAEMAYEKVLQFAGASLHRDALDELVADDVANGKAIMTGSGLDSGFINSQDDVKSAIPSVWPVLEQGQAPKDTDGDGMPDEWETAHGLNANDAADGNQKGEGGYTNLEVYLNGIVAHITAAQNEGGEQTGYIEEVIVPGDDNEPGKTLVGAGSVNWKLDAGNAGQTATYADQIADEIGKNSITLGSNISYGGTQAITGAGRITKFQSAVKNEALANDGNAVAFSFTMADGYFFRPTKVAFYACRCGTDGGRLDIYWQTPDEKKELELGLTPERNNNYTAFEKEINTVGSASGTSSLVCHILSLGTGKAIAIGNVSISGEVKSETDGIAEIRRVTLGGGRFYNLQGMGVAHPSKGIYIRDGKKVMVK